MITKILTVTLEITCLNNIPVGGVVIDGRDISEFLTPAELVLAITEKIKPSKPEEVKEAREETETFTKTIESFEDIPAFNSSGYVKKGRLTPPFKGKKKTRKRKTPKDFSTPRNRGKQVPICLSGILQILQESKITPSEIQRDVKILLYPSQFGNGENKLMHKEGARALISYVNERRRSLLDLEPIGLNDIGKPYPPPSRPDKVSKLTKPEVNVIDTSKLPDVHHYKQPEGRFVSVSKTTLFSVMKKAGIPNIRELNRICGTHISLAEFKETGSKQFRLGTVEWVIDGINKACNLGGLGDILITTLTGPID